MTRSKPKAEAQPVESPGLSSEAKKVALITGLMTVQSYCRSYYPHDSGLQAMLQYLTHIAQE